MEEIPVLFTTDLHGRLFSPAAGGKGDSGSFASFLTALQQEKEQHDSMLLIDNGDALQGSELLRYYSRNRSGENPVIRLFNDIGLDAFIPGNHDFNFGQDYLQEAFAQSNFPWLAANVVDKQGEPAFGRPYLVKEFGGVKAAVLGVTTRFTSTIEAPGRLNGWQFIEPAQAARDWADRLAAEIRPELLIISYHGGLERDLDTGRKLDGSPLDNEACSIAEAVPEAQLLITGHEHLLQEGFLGTTLVIQPGCFGKHYGKAVFTAAPGKAAELRSHAILPLDGIPPADLPEELTRLNEATERYLNEPVTGLAHNLNVPDVTKAQQEKHPLIQLIGRLQLEASGAQLTAASFFTAAPGFDGPVFPGDILRNYPFSSSLIIQDVPGVRLLAALERTACYFEPDGKGGLTVSAEFREPYLQAHTFLMWEGLDYVIDLTRPRGSRIASCTIAGEPLRKDAFYETAILNYYYHGGAGYTMFRDLPIKREVLTDTAELLEQHFRKAKSLAIPVTPNWKIIS